MNRRSFLRTVCAGSSVVGLAGCSGSDPSDDEPSSVDGTLVEMTDELTFEPASVEVPLSGAVVWRNVGGVPHTVTAYGDGIPADAAYFASGGFASEEAARDGYDRGALGDGDDFTHTFETPGEYRYFCLPHEGAEMTGSVTVTATAELTK